MAKKTKVIVAQGLKLDGEYLPLGAELALPEKEAARLLELGAVTLPPAPAPAAAASSPAPSPAPAGAAETAPPADAAEQELLARIAETQTEAELLALVPGDEARPAVVEAASAKLVELTGGR